MMKRFLFCGTLVLSVLMILACKTTTAATAPITTQEQANEALQEIYNEYKSDLILEGAKTYTVVRGDVLNAISRREYNNGFYFPLIMLASSDVVLDPDQIEPGMNLIIPDLQRNLNNANAKGRIKNFLREIADIEDRRDRPQDAEGLRKLADSL
jgi:PhoPQ-activated pathogenicity-related protein